MHPPLKTTLKKSAGQMQCERQAIQALWQKFFRQLGGIFRLNGWGAGEGEGNCGMVPTAKHCPSWVAKFKARSCNPHTGDHFAFSSTTTLW
jgi:hypothetical protein